MTSFSAFSTARAILTRPSLPLSGRDVCFRVTCLQCFPESRNCSSFHLSASLPVLPSLNCSSTTSSLSVYPYLLLHPPLCWLSIPTCSSIHMCSSTHLFAPCLSFNCSSTTSSIPIYPSTFLYQSLRLHIYLQLFLSTFLLSWLSNSPFSTHFSAFLSIHSPLSIHFSSLLSIPTISSDPSSPCSLSIHLFLPNSTPPCLFLPFPLFISPPLSDHPLNRVYMFVVLTRITPKTPYDTNVL